MTSALRARMFLKYALRIPLEVWTSKFLEGQEDFDSESKEVHVRERTAAFIAEQTRYE